LFLKIIFKLFYPSGDHPQGGESGPLAPSHDGVQPLPRIGAK